MTADEARMMALWTEEGLLTEGIGPQVEWSPVVPLKAQERHRLYWSAVSGMIPDDEDDEPYWMTEAATAQLLNN